MLLKAVPVVILVTCKVEFISKKQVLAVSFTQMVTAPAHGDFLLGSKKGRT